MTDDEARSRSHVEWSAKAQATIAEDYDRLHAEAAADPQKAGHGGETTWLRFLRDWLPPTYEVATRKYVVPEVGDDVFETDIVVFHPSYPTSLREKEEVLSSGVAAAFSVKLTLDAAGLRDACERACRLERGVIFEPDGTDLRSYTTATYPRGVLAHSHRWKSPGSDPIENVNRGLHEASTTLASTPRELMELVCVADLACWGPMEARWAEQLSQALVIGPNDAFLRRYPGEGFPPEMGIQAPGDTTIPEAALIEGLFTGIGHGVHGTSARSNPLAAFVSLLYELLAASDPSLRRVSEGLKRLQSADASRANLYQWPLGSVYPKAAQRAHRIGRFAPGQDPADRPRMVAERQANARRGIEAWIEQQRTVGDGDGSATG